MKNNIFKIFLNSIPILIMIGLIPVVGNDYWLALIYCLIITISFWIKYEKREYIIILFGLFIMIICEAIFLSTGVEVFNRNTLFGIMPIWLPLLWGYAFVAIKRGIKLLEI
ncbi:MAG TPA: DUF2878 family protein [Candidatus Moranbacteria bacterium]|nr:DUF2878 family protein [Candidatus Moranbacteria bacterium]